MSQLQRLMEIDRLVRAGKVPTPDDLARRLGVTKRQIFLDRKHLKDELGAPLSWDRKRGGWIYTDQTWILPTAIMTEGELLAFFLSVEIARSTGNGGIEESLASAVAKIARSLGEVVSIDLNALRGALSFSAPPAARVNAHTAMQLMRAEAARRKVSMLYNSASGGQTKWRVVHPYHLHLARGEWILLAFDEDRQELRSFNAHRIEQLQIQKVSFVRALDFDPEKSKREVLWAETGKCIHDVAVAFDAYQARYIRERSWHPEERVEEADGGGLTLYFPASGLQEVARWVMGYGKHARVMEPPELREIVASHVRELAQIYGDQR